MAPPAVLSAMLNDYSVEVKLARELTKKQRLFVKYLAETLSPTEAAFRAYDCKDKNSACAIAHQNLEKLSISMSELMNKMGLTPEEDIKDLQRLRKATKPISCNIYIDKNGEMKNADGKSQDFVEVDDNPTQLKALELTLKMRGALKEVNLNQHYHQHWVVKWVGNGRVS